MSFSLPEPIGLSRQHLTKYPVQLVFHDEHRKAIVQTKDGRFITRVKKCSDFGFGGPWTEFRDQDDKAFYKLKRKTKFMGSKFELRDMKDQPLVILESSGSTRLDVSFTSYISDPPKQTSLMVKRERWGHDYDIFCGPKLDVVAAKARRDKKFLQKAEWTIDVAEGVDVMIIIAAILTFGAITKGSSAAGSSAAMAGAAAGAGGGGGGGC